MKVTAIELTDDRKSFPEQWARLKAYLKQERSELVLLPEIPFSGWFAFERPFKPSVWQEAVEAHERSQPLLEELPCPWIAGTRPVSESGRRYNEGFLWTKEERYRRAHRKVHLPDEEPVWEKTWYHAGEDDFSTINVEGAEVGFLICTELWFFDEARRYGKRNADLLLTPRKTGRETLDKWLVGGKAAAISAGAYSLSSNSSGAHGFGGLGWIIDPDGNVLATTSENDPFVTVDIDLRTARNAKQTYPRYID